MQILKAYKFRLEPTAQQAQRLRQLGGCARCVWKSRAGSKTNAFWMLAKNFTTLPLS